MTETASKRGRRSRTKGKVWERAVAAMLRPIFGDDEVKRGWQSRAGNEQCDVEGTPFWIECKCGTTVDMRAAMRQAMRDADCRPPVVIAKDERKPPGWRVGDPGAPALVVMRLEDWLSLVKSIDSAG